MNRREDAFAAIGRALDALLDKHSGDPDVRAAVDAIALQVGALRFPRRRSLAPAALARRLERVISDASTRIPSGDPAAAARAASDLAAASTWAHYLRRDGGREDCTGGAMAAAGFAHRCALRLHDASTPAGRLDAARGLLERATLVRDLARATLAALDTEARESKEVRHAAHA